MKEKKNHSLQWDKLKDEEDHKKTASFSAEKSSDENLRDRENQVFQRNYTIAYSSDQNKKRYRLWNKYKTFILSALTAVIIGSLLGFVMLTIFVDLDPDEVQFDQQSPVEAVTSNADEEAGGETVQMEHQTATMHFFVIQAGIFSNKEAADQLVRSLETENIKGMIWQREENYHVFAGVHPTHQQSKQFASESLLSSNEIYAGKEWATNSKSINLSEPEQNWLAKVETEIDQLIQNPTNRSTLEKLIEDKPADISDKLEGIVGLLEDYLKMDNNQHLQVQLLKIMHDYEQMPNG